LIFLLFFLLFWKREEICSLFSSFLLSFSCVEQCYNDQKNIMSFSACDRLRSNATMIVFSYSSSIKKQKRNVRMQQGVHSLHKNIQNCMAFFRSSLFLSLFLLFDKASFFVFFFYLFHLCHRRQKESCYNTQCLDNDVMCLCICVPFPGNVDVVPHTHSFNHLSIQMLSICFFTTDTRLSVCMFKLDYIIFQKKKEEKKRK